jgi:hypothetical protein
MVPLEEQFAGVSLGSDDPVKQLHSFAMSKDMSKPTYKLISRLSDGKLCYSCSVKVSSELHFWHRAVVKMFCVL